MSPLLAVLLAAFVGWPTLVALVVVAVARWGALQDRRAAGAAVLAEAERILTGAARPR